MAKATHVNPSVDWTDVRNVLCVRVDGGGDLLMTTPAIRAMKESAPDRRVTVLASKTGAEVAALVPEIDAVIPYDPPWMKATPPRTSGPDFAVLEQVRKARFDAAVILTVYSQNPLPAVLFCYLADIPRRLAYCRENPYQLLTDWLPEPEPQSVTRHETHRQLDLVAAAGCTTGDVLLSLRVADTALVTVRKLLMGAGVESRRPWVALHPGATAPSRRYPPEHFAQAARLLADDGFQLVFTGDASERGLVDDIRRMAAAPSISLAGRLSVAELAALISLAPVLVSNNTLPVHIAAAVQTPVVDIYAQTNLQHTPWQVRHYLLSHDVPCKNCYKSVCPLGHHDCLRLVDPREVADAVRSLMAETAKDLARKVAHAPTR